MRPTKYLLGLLLLATSAAADNNIAVDTTQLRWAAAFGNGLAGTWGGTDGTILAYYGNSMNGTASADTSNPARSCTKYTTSGSGTYSHAGILSQYTSSPAFLSSYPRMWVVFRTHTDLNNQRMSFGVASSGNVYQQDVPSSTLAGKSYFLRYSSTMATPNWWCCRTDGVGSNAGVCEDTGVAAIAAHTYRLYFERNLDGDYLLKLDGVTLCSHPAGTSTLPVDTSIPFPYTLGVSQIGADAVNTKTICLESLYYRYGAGP